MYSDLTLVPEVASIVREASRLMTERTQAGQIEQKGNDSNYVTATDKAVEDYLTERLLLLLPGSKVLGEEDDNRSTDRECLWIIDPIDGTSNYIRDLGLSVISVGLMQKGELTMGVVYHPYRDEMFSAEKGKGAYVNDRPIHVSDRDFRHSHLCSAMSLYDKRWAEPCFRVISRVYEASDDLRRLGTAALELCYVAAGRVELYFEMRLNCWDVAAAFCIIREAGGIVESIYEPVLPLDHPFLTVAANTEENYRRLADIVREEIPVTPYDH